MLNSSESPVHIIHCKTMDNVKWVCSLIIIHPRHPRAQQTVLTLCDHPIKNVPSQTAYSRKTKKNTLYNFAAQRSITKLFIILIHIIKKTNPSSLFVSRFFRIFFLSI